ncbi:MAG: sel1 repeat family protein, partial [Nitrospinaceae bacterium]|nr:sel1 repeat family protein [Nitrospinaceae bacterium]
MNKGTKHFQLAPMKKKECHSQVMKSTTSSLQCWKALTAALTVVILFGCGSRNGLEELKAEAEKGDVQAQFSLAGMYTQGKGVPQDYIEAAKWLRLAADQGFPLAQS